jgi:hypothetical protein
VALVLGDIPDHSPKSESLRGLGPPRFSISAFALAAAPFRSEGVWIRSKRSGLAEVRSRFHNNTDHSVLITRMQSDRRLLNENYLPELTWLSESAAGSENQENAGSPNTLRTAWSMAFHAYQ